MLPRIRHYKDGDEKEIANMLTKSFDTFRIFDMDGDKWLKYQEIDSGFYLHNAIIIESDDTIVGHAQIICRDLKIGESTFVRVGGVGNICVLSEYRKKGIATMIMNYVHQCAKNLELPISALLVQEKSGAQSLYKKLGYNNILTLNDICCDTEELKQKTDKSLRSNITIKPYRSGDEVGMLEVYHQSGRCLSGIQKRDIEYWRRRYTSVFTYNGFFYESFDPNNVLIARKNNTICGYSFVNCVGKTGYIREFFVLPEQEDSIPNLVNSSVNRLSSLGVNNVCFLDVIALKYEIFKNIIGHIEVRISPHDQFMARIIDLYTLMKGLEPEISERLRKKIQSGKVLQLSVNEQEITIIINNGMQLCKERFEKYDITYTFDEECFLKLLFGVISVDKAMNEKNVSVSPNSNTSIKILELMFPKKNFCMCIGDVW
ncbi:MAG: hypothetical protein C5S48_02515 [Candidatus Methanogaster sp.]|nr:MAG: hypothetical protein C5S48_02515 [ANME-2 cluster archaeon]